MAQAMKDLGSKEVTIVELQDRLLPTEEPFAGEIIEKVFTKEYGIKVVTGVGIKSFKHSDSREVKAYLQDGQKLQGNEILLALGRRPNTGDIGLESIGLQAGQTLQMDDYLRSTEVEGGWLYATDDVNGRPLLTHQGKYQARIVGDVILGKDIAAWADHTAVTRVAFFDPQVAAVGLTESAAQEAGIHLKVVEYTCGATAGAALRGQLKRFLPGNWIAPALRRPR